MNYDWMKYEDIEKATYPNLLAEIKESHYSICTVADHMGLGRRQEDDQETWDKLTGRKDIFASEIVGLKGLFNAQYEYLFSDELQKEAGEPLAKVRWMDENIRMQMDLEDMKIKDEWYRLFCNEVADITLRCLDMGQKKYASWKKKVVDQCPEECREFTEQFLRIIDRKLNNTRSEAWKKINAGS